jgi:type I restriction enzyme, S subunit
MDYRGRTPKKLGMEWGGGDIAALSARNVKKGYVDLEEDTYHGSDALYRRWMSHGDPHPGDIVLTTEAPLGNLAYLPDARRYILSQRTVLLRIDPRLADANYVFHAMQAQPFQRLLRENSTGSTATGIQRRRLEALPLRIPASLVEQARIAAVLADVDALVRQLDKVGEKKRDVGHATLRQLVSGGMRLPGYSDAWRIRRIGDVLRVRHGKSQRQVETKGGRYPILGTGGEIGRAMEPLYSHPSVLIGRKGTIDRPQYSAEPFWSIDTLFYTEVGPDAVPKFLYYLFTTINWYGHNESSGRPSLNATTIENIEIRLPMREEQTAIVQVLSDLDAESRALEARLAKTKALKEGIAQQLLSERTRLA